jgi:uncharacterized membrane protein YeaQ/YmgE (transglycosylase-associated protein family)
MATIEEVVRQRERAHGADVAEMRYEEWTHWPVNWSAVWVGSLAALSAVLIIGLVGTAIGAYAFQPDSRIVDLHKVAIGSLIFGVCGAFFAFVIGGWIAGKIAGILRAEPAMLHGAIVWLVATPILVVLAALGAGSYMGSWNAGLAGTPSWAAPQALPFEKPDLPGVTATAEERAAYRTALEKYRDQVTQWKADTPRVVRHSALGAVTALLLGLVGSVVGGWMACGEPMTFTYHRTRRNLAATHHG